MKRVCSVHFFAKAIHFESEMSWDCARWRKTYNNKSLGDVKQHAFLHARSEKKKLTNDKWHKFLTSVCMSI